MPLSWEVRAPGCQKGGGGPLALPPGVNTSAGAWHKRKEIGSLSLENWSQSGQTRDTAGVTRGLQAALAAGWKIVNSQRMLFACMRPGEAAQVLGERQRAQEQSRALS